MELFANRVVVKVGSSTLTDEQGGCNLHVFDRLACVLSDISNMGREVILVSSGAIAVGRGKLHYRARQLPQGMKQAAAAVGQSSIINLYDKYFGDYGKTIAQILLCAEDIVQKEKKDNLVHTLNTLLGLGVIPVVNENDSVSAGDRTQEERLFGDNDMLSAVVAELCCAGRLVIFSDIDGLYDADPRRHPHAKRISRVEQIDERIYALAGGAGSSRGTGEMRTKLQAAARATALGIDTMIAHGSAPEQLYAMLDGEAVGTLFVGHKAEQ